MNNRQSKETNYSGLNLILMQNTLQKSLKKNYFAKFLLPFLLQLGTYLSEVVKDG